MGLIDKGCKASVKTGTAVTKASESLVHTSVKQGVSLLTNRTSDIYDQHDNLSDGLGKSAVGKGTMLLRSNYRMARAAGRSAFNAKKKNIAKEVYIKNHYITDKGTAAWNTLTDAEKSSIDKSQFIKRKGNQAWNDLPNNSKREILYAKEGWKGKRRKEKWQYYNTQGIKKGIGITSTRNSLVKSSRNIISNQTRKGLSTVVNKNDISSKAIGSSIRGTRQIWKNKRRIQQSSIKVVSIIKKMITGLISFVTSIPAMLSALIGSLPVLLVVAFLIIVACFFGEDLEFSGRVSILSEGEIKLENDYQTSINPEEILAITSVLGWTTPDFADYEMLMSFAMDGKRGAEFSFETMMDNVFNKYNPAVKLNPSEPVDRNENTDWKYWTSEIWHNKVVEFQIFKGSWLKLYPSYKNASVSDKKQMGTKEYIDDMKARCRKALEVNGYNYLATFLTIDNPPDIFKNHVIPKDAGAKVSSPTGYRSIVLNNVTDNTFHYGTDISVAGGTPVYAPADMDVVYADGTQTIEGSPIGLWGAGNVVVLKKSMFDRKGKECYLYIALCHLQHNSVSVSAGQGIKSGTQVGKVGTTGTSTGNHLHFQTWISVNNYTKDSIKWVNVSPNKFSDETVGKTYDINDHNYEAIYLEGLLFYDIEYRNSLFR